MTVVTFLDGRTTIKFGRRCRKKIASQKIYYYPENSLLAKNFLFHFVTNI
jgi:hypothetical protein